MAISLQCPGCTSAMQVPDALRGSQVRCPSCRRTFFCNQDGSAGPLESPALPAEPAPEIPSAAESPSDSTLPEPKRVFDDPHGEFFPCAYCAEIIPGHVPHCPFCGERVDLGQRWVRRDVMPHRGALIMVLGVLSLVCVAGVLFCFIGPIFNLVGVGVGGAAWLLGNRDLARILRGDMDPDGQMQSKSGRNCGIIGVVLNLLGLAAYIVFYILIIGVRAFR